MSMKKLLALLLALAMCLGLAACGEKEPAAGGGEESKVFKIGIVEPITGGSSFNGANQIAGIKAALKDWIEHYGNPGGFEIELVVGDSQGSADVGVTEAERLITSEKVSAILGTYNSGVAAAVAPICIKYEMPFMVINAVSDGILGTDSNFVFRANNCDTIGAQLNKGYMEFLDAECLKQTGHPLKVAILADSGEWGQSNGAAAKQKYQDCGIEIVYEETIDTGVQDLSTVVTKLKAANADYVACFIYFDEAVLLVRQCKEQNYPFVGGGGGGFASADFIPALGEDAEYCTASGGFIYDPSSMTDEANAIADDFVKNTEGAVAPDEAFANGWLGMYCLMHAIDACKSTDPAEVAKALDATNLINDGKERTFMFNNVMPSVTFEDFPTYDGGMLYNQNPNAVIAYTQVHDGYYKATYPVDPTPLVINPPAWSDR